jgi:hypothetical protein
VSAYREAASVPGAWWCPIALPDIAVAQVRAAMEEVARAKGVPFAAFLRGHQPTVRELIIVRVPSRDYGTPSIPASALAAHDLAQHAGWNLMDPRPTPAVVAGLSLREGDQSTDPLWSIAQARARLREQAVTGTTWPARLVSLRVVNDTTQWSIEPGIVVQTQPRHLTGITRVAAALGRRPVCVTDWNGVRTVSLHHATSDIGAVS